MGETELHAEIRNTKSGIEDTTLLLTSAVTENVRQDKGQRKSKGWRGERVLEIKIKKKEWG